MVWELPIPYLILTISRAYAACSLGRGRLSRSTVAHDKKSKWEAANSSILTLSVYQKEFAKEACNIEYWKLRII